MEVFFLFYQGHTLLIFYLTISIWHFYFLHLQTTLRDIFLEFFRRNMDFDDIEAKQISFSRYQYIN